MPTIDPGSMLSNPVTLGLVVFLIVHVLKLLKLPKDGKETLWLVMGASVLIAFIDLLAGGKLVPLPAVPASGISEPLAFLSFVGAVVGAVAQEAGLVLAWSQMIYMLLHQQILLGDSV